MNIFSAVNIKNLTPEEFLKIRKPILSIMDDVEINLETDSYDYKIKYTTPEYGNYYIYTYGLPYVDDNEFKEGAKNIINEMDEFHRGRNATLKEIKRSVKNLYLPNYNIKSINAILTCISEDGLKYTQIPIEKMHKFKNTEIIGTNRYHQIRAILDKKEILGYDALYMSVEISKDNVERLFDMGKKDNKKSNDISKLL